MKRRMVPQETKQRERKSAKEREAKERENEPEEIKLEKRKTVGSELRRKAKDLRHKKTLPFIGRVSFVGPRRLELLTFRV